MIVNRQCILFIFVFVVTIAVSRHLKADDTPICHEKVVYTVAFDRSSTRHGPGTLDFWDATSLQHLGVVTIGSAPAQVVAHPRKPLAYVIDYGKDFLTYPPQYPGQVYVVDVVRRGIVTRVDVGFTPASAAITPDGQRLFVANSDSVSILDTASNSVVATVAVTDPTVIAAHPDGHSMWVAGRDGTLSVLDPATNAIRDHFNVAAFLYGVAIRSDGKFAYVSGDTNDHGYSRNIFEIDTITGATVRTLSPRRESVGFFALTKDGRFAIKAGNDLTPPMVIDLQTGEDAYICNDGEPNCILESDDPAGSVVVWPEKNWAYLIGGGVVDLNTRTVIGQIAGRVDAVDIGNCFKISHQTTSSEGCAVNPQSGELSWAVLWFVGWVLLIIVHRRLMHCTALSLACPEAARNKERVKGRGAEFPTLPNRALGEPRFAFCRTPTDIRLNCGRK